MLSLYQNPCGLSIVKKQKTEVPFCHTLLKLAQKYARIIINNIIFSHEKYKYCSVIINRLLYFFGKIKLRISI